VCHLRVYEILSEDHPPPIRVRFEWSRRGGFLVCVQSYKKGSPSSGLFRVKIYDEHGMPSRTGPGIFPRAVMQRFPLLPLEEEGRLNDLPLRENFIERVFAYYRWAEMLKSDPTPGGLVRFHTAHKLTLMAHSIKCHR
jgi:hypothetical protein